MGTQTGTNGVNFENLAKLREAVEKAGPDGFCMRRTDIYRPENNITACCFYNADIAKGKQFENWLRIPHEIAYKLIYFVPAEYSKWTREERWKWALRRLDELKETGTLQSLPLYFVNISNE